MDPRSLIGKRLDDLAVPTPAVVLDRAAVERNCSNMLRATRALNLGWRAHIKTHKTTELTRLMVGEDGPANIVVSTMLEAEKICPQLAAYKAAGRPVNMLYGFPLYTSALARLAAVGRVLGPGSITVIVDHPVQIPVAEQLSQQLGFAVAVFLKINMGTNRSGVLTSSPECAEIMDKLLQTHTLAASASSSSSSPGLLFHGLYCHAGHSYDARKPWSSMAHLVSEFSALGVAAKQVRDAAAAATTAITVPKLTLSVGASPTVATLQHADLGGNGSAGSDEDRAKAAELRATFEALRRDNGDVHLEAHAGVYPVRDLQQLATHSWAGADAAPSAQLADLAMTVLADVASVYPGRGPGGRSDEVLVNAGCLALARESIKNTTGSAHVYDAFGIVLPWTADVPALAVPDAEFPALAPADGHKGWWQVARISQEHGILQWVGGQPASAEAVAAATPAVGQRVRIWPNHACITAAMYSYFLVVDSRAGGDEATKIVDVWERWVGWV